MGWNKINGKLIWQDRTEELKNKTKEELIEYIIELEHEYNALRKELNF